MRARRGETGRARPRRSASRGAASVEYGLLVALIGGVLCLGIGATVNELFGHTIACLVTSLQSAGGTDASCPSTDLTPGGTGEPGGPSGPGPSTSTSATPTPTLTPTPSPSTTPTPSSSP